MKKILSLLSMLMITVMAFATDYKGQLDYTVTTRTGDLTGPSNAQGVLKIEPYAGGKYTVTATGCDLSSIELGNWDEIICEGVEGTTDANGVTTIDVAPYAFRGSDNAELKNAKLFVKFKGNKAYATFEGTYDPNFYTNYKLKYTFGVDEGFEGGGSTGGGETGGETSSIVTVKENFQSTEGSSWGENVTIDWTTQKLVVSVNLASTGSDKGFLGVTKKGQTAGWNNDGIIFYNTNGSTVQGYAPGQPNNANTDQVTKGEDPVRFEISKDGGVKCQGNVVISASNIAHLTNQSEIVVGAADKPAGAFYNYIKVVPLDWTEVPPVTVVDTKEFKNVAYTTSMGGNGTATVTFTEMSDGTFPMTFVSDDLNVKAENLTKGTDEKGRTTYTGTAKRTDVDVTFTVKAVVYTEGTEEKLYMTMVSVDGTTFTVGEDPDYVAPEPEIEGTVVEGSKNYAANGSKFEWSNIAINWNKQKLVAVIDLSSCTGTSENILSVGQNIGSWSIGGWHFYYTVASKKMKSDYLATGGAHPVSDPKTGVEPGTVRIELSKAEGCTIDGVSYNALYDSSVTGTWQSNTEDFWNLTSVNIGSKEGVNRSNAVIKYVTVVDLPVTVKDEKTFNEALYMQDQKVADATVVVKEMSDETINMSLKFGENEYTSTELTKGTDEKNRTTYTGKVANGTQTYDVAGVVYEKDNVARLYMTLKTSITTVVVGENPDVVTPEVYTSNLHIYDAAAPETDLFQADQAKVEFLATATGEFKLTLKDVKLNEKTQDLVFTGALPTPQPGGQDPLAEEGETTPAEPAMVLNATADEATTDFFGGGATYATAVFNVSYDKNDNFMMTFTIAAAAGKNYAGEFNYVKKTPDTPDPELFCKENYVADGEGFEWEIAVDWDTQKIVMSIDPSTCTGSCEDVIGLGAVPTAWDNTLHLYRTSADQMLQGYFNVPGGSNNNTDKFAETAPFLVEVSKAQGFVVNNEVKIAASAMSYLFTLPTVKMGTGEGANDKSRATYNYVKVVDKDWTAPKDPDTGINATTVAEGEVEFFTVNGVKLNKLQKGLNIVRTADGKVKKVLVK